MSVYRFPHITTSRLQSMKVFSFTFTLWKMDKRPWEERKVDPKIMDIGVTEYILPDSRHDLRVHSCSHWVVNENRFMSNPKTKPVVCPILSAHSVLRTELNAKINRTSNMVIPKLWIRVKSPLACRNCSRRHLRMSCCLSMTKKRRCKSSHPFKSTFQRGRLDCMTRSNPHFLRQTLNGDDRDLLKGIPTMIPDSDGVHQCDP